MDRLQRAAACKRYIEQCRAAPETWRALAERIGIDWSTLWKGMAEDSVPQMKTIERIEAAMEGEKKR